MTWIVSANGTKCTTAPQTAGFTNGSANITLPNTCVAGDLVVFSTTGTLPTNFTAGQTYFVIATGLTTANIQVSATSGGAAISAGSAGTGTQTATVEHVLASDATNATYYFQANLTNIAAITSGGPIADILELYLWTSDTGAAGVYNRTWKDARQFTQTMAEKASPFVPSDAGILATMRQSAIAGSVTCTFTASSAVITATQSLVAGDVVAFSSTGTLPTGISAGTAYFVISTGLSGTQFEVSATQGGAAIVPSTAGTGTITATLIGRPIPWKLLRQ